MNAPPTNPVTLDEVLAELRAVRQEVAQLRQATPQHLVDLQTAAKHLGVSARTVKRWVAEDRIAYRRIGRTLRFPLAALNPPSDPTG